MSGLEPEPDDEGALGCTFAAVAVLVLALGLCLGGMAVDLAIWWWLHGTR